nr:hypothetical protein [Tanacetum cinerariifolium]
MTTPTFAKTYNLIADLAKPVESKGFEKIIDFLNGSSVRYALIASPTIRTSCIKQFWSTTKVKTVNDEVMVQALIYAKMVNIKESSIRHTLKLDDEEGTSCLANDEIFTGLANMGYEKISDKLTFYKAFFSPQWKFLIHTILQCLSTKTPRGMNLAALWHQQSYVLPQTRNLTSQVDHQLGDISHHQDIYGNPSLTKKVFANMKRVGTGFSGVITPLFENMLVPAAEEVELMDLCTRLSNKVMDLESEVIDIKSSFTDKIEQLEDKVHKLEEENRILKEKSFKSAKIDTAAPVVTIAAAQVPKESAPRRRRGVVIQDPEETAASVIVQTEVQPKDKGKGILIEELKPLKRQAQIEQDVAFARQLEAELNANINWNDVIEQVKRSKRQNNTVMRYQALKRKPLTEAQARKNMMIYLNMAKKVEEEVTVQEKEIEEEGNKRQDESLEQEIAKKQRMDEEADELKRHLQIVANDDDVEDLETLWKLVKERFETTEPKNFSDDFLLNIIRIMFEKPVIEANMFLLVEKKNPLTHFTLQQMINNVRLEVEEESEMSLELLRLVRRQQNEGGRLLGLMDFNNYCCSSYLVLLLEITTANEEI